MVSHSRRIASRTGSVDRPGPRLLLGAIAAVILCSCATGGQSVPVRVAEAPRVAALEVAPSTGSLELNWIVDRGPDDVFGGFNVYILRQSVTQNGPVEAMLRRARPVNPSPYPGDADGDVRRESYKADGLEDGVRYYCTVASLTATGEIARWTPEIMAICRPGGRAVLQPIFSGDQDGFDFAAGRHVNTDAIECHVAFYVRASTDHLISPSRIDPLIPETRFWDAGAHTDCDALVEWQPEDTGVTTLVTRRGHTYVYRTAGGNYGKFWIADITGQGDLRTIDFEFMYQPIPDLIHLR